MPNCELVKVTKIEVLEGLRIALHFSGKTKVVDIADSDLPKRFPKLKDRAYFESAKLDGGSVSWPDGLQIDLDEMVHDWPDAHAEPLPVASSYEKIEHHYKKN